MGCSIPGSLSFAISWSLLRLMSIEPVIPSKHLILCCPLCLLPSIFPSIRVFSIESALLIRWPKYWSFSFSVSPSKKYSGMISFRIDCLDFPAVQGTLKSLLQYYSSIFQCSAFFIVQVSHPYMTIGKTIALTRWMFFNKVMSLLFNMLSRFVKFCEFEQVPGDGDGQESLACCSPWGHKDHTQTPLSNWTPPLHNNNNGIKNNIKASTLYNRELLLNENRVSVWDDEKVLRMNGGDVCTILWMYWMPLNRSLENNSNDNFYAMCFLPQWKKM